MLGSFRNFLLPDGQSVLEQAPKSYWLGAACNASLILLLAGWAAWSLWRRLSGWKKDSHAYRLQSLVCVVLILLYMGLPYQFFGTVNPSGRLLIPLLAIASCLAGGNHAVWRWAAWPAAFGASLTWAGYATLIHRLPDAPLGYELRFKSADAPIGSVFAFNDALYANTRYKYFNYRVLMGSQRYEQLARGDYSGLGFRTGLIVDYQPGPN